MKHIKGPDFPTGGELVSPFEDILAIYKTGVGTLKLRACYEIQKGDIVITELPFQVSGAKILEQIAAQMRTKKLPMVEDLRDESDHESPIRLVISPRSSRVDKEALMGHLFATTELERTIRVNLNVIALDGRPMVFGLKPMLEEWLAFRINTVKRRLSYRLERVMDRIHTLEGLLIAYLNIDEVIKIIRETDDPEHELMMSFKLSDIQAQAIMDLRLKNLAKLESEKIIENARESITQEKDLILKDLKSQVVDLSVEIASKILKKELNEKQKQVDYTQKLIDEIEIK